MKKIISLASGLLVLLVFESCTKDQPVSNSSKKAAVSQQSSSDPQSQPSSPPSSCPHAGAKTQQQG